MANEKPNQPQDESRRRFLKYSGTAIGGVVLGGVIGGLVGANLKDTDKEETPAAPQTTTDKDYNQALMFFNQNQFLTAEAASERLFPTDDLGPGAKELGVAFFIDHQMASAYGTNSRDYMQPPYYKAEATQGYQLIFKRRELIALGLDTMDDYSNKKYQKAFVEITPEEQDAVLKAFESDDIGEIKNVPASTFFAMFLNLTLEGLYADPLYGGNKNMGGWKMRNFPGNQMSYTEYIEKEEFVKLEPMSLHDHLELG